MDTPSEQSSGLTPGRLSSTFYINDSSKIKKKRRGYWKIETPKNTDKSYSFIPSNINKHSRPENQLRSTQNFYTTKSKNRKKLHLPLSDNSSSKMGNFFTRLNISFAYDRLNSLQGGHLDQFLGSETLEITSSIFKDYMSQYSAYYSNGTPFSKDDFGGGSKELRALWNLLQSPPVQEVGHLFFQVVLEKLLKALKAPKNSYLQYLIIFVKKTLQSEYLKIINRVNQKINTSTGSKIIDDLKYANLEVKFEEISKKFDKKNKHNKELRELLKTKEDQIQSLIKRSDSRMKEMSEKFGIRQERFDLTMKASSNWVKREEKMKAQLLELQMEVSKGKKQAMDLSRAKRVLEDKASICKKSHISVHQYKINEGESYLKNIKLEKDIRQLNYKCKTLQEEIYMLEGGSYELWKQKKLGMAVRLFLLSIKDTFSKIKEQREAYTQTEVIKKVNKVVQVCTIKVGTSSGPNQDLSKGNFLCLKRNLSDKNKKEHPKNLKQQTSVSNTQTRAGDINQDNIDIEEEIEEEEEEDEGNERVIMPRSTALDSLKSQTIHLKFVESQYKQILRSLKYKSDMLEKKEKQFESFKKLHLECQVGQIHNFLNRRASKIERQKILEGMNQATSSNFNPQPKGRSSKKRAGAMVFGTQEYEEIEKTFDQWRNESILIQKSYPKMDLSSGPLRVELVIMIHNLVKSHIRHITKSKENNRFSIHATVINFFFKKYKNVAFTQKEFIHFCQTCYQNQKIPKINLFIKITSLLESSHFDFEIGIYASQLISHFSFDSFLKETEELVHFDRVVKYIKMKIKDSSQKQLIERLQQLKKKVDLTGLNLKYKGATDSFVNMDAAVLLMIRSKSNVLKTQKEWLEMVYDSVLLDLKGDDGISLLDFYRLFDVVHGGMKDTMRMEIEEEMNLREGDNEFLEQVDLSKYKYLTICSNLHLLLKEQVLEYLGVDEENTIQMAFQELSGGLEGLVDELMLKIKELKMRNPLLKESIPHLKRSLAVFKEGVEHLENLDEYYMIYQILRYRFVEHQISEDHLQYMNGLIGFDDGGTADDENSIDDSKSEMEEIMEVQ